MEGFCTPLRAQGWQIYNFNNISLNWIYHANNWVRNIIWRVPVRPYGHMVGKYTISIILVFTGYIMATIGGGIEFVGFLCALTGAGIGNIQFQKYYFVSDISCQQLGEEYNFEGFCAPLRAQGWETYNLNNISLYWIYHANNYVHSWKCPCK